MPPQEGGCATGGLDRHTDGLDKVLERRRVWTLPLPCVLLPRISAVERAEYNHHCFDATIDLPWLGTLACIEVRWPCQRSEQARAA